MRAERWGVLLILAGLAMGGLAHESMPPPVSLEQWLCCNGNGGESFIARGPPVVRYDPDADVTYAVFQCAHDYCRTAATLRGDARHVANASSVLLVTGYVPPPRGERALDEPVIVESWQHGDVPVTNATLQEFTVTPRAAHVAPRLVAFTLVAVGVLVAWHPPRRVVGAASAAAVVGLAAGVAFARGGPAIAMMPVAFLGLVAALAVLTAVASVRRPTLRAWPWVPVALAAGMLAALVVTAPYFTHPPMA